LGNSAAAMGATTPAQRGGYWLGSLGLAQLAWLDQLWRGSSLELVQYNLLALLGSGLLNLACLGSVQFGSSWLSLLGSDQLAWLSWLGLAWLAWLNLAGLGLAARTRRSHPIDDALCAINDSSIVVLHCLSRSAEADGIFGG
jgi:hypothetical protein